MLLEAPGIGERLIAAYNQAFEAANAQGSVLYIQSPEFSRMVMEVLHFVNEKLSLIKDSDLRESTKRAAAELAVRLVLELIRELEIDIFDLLPRFNKIVQASCTIHGYDYNDFLKYVNLQGAGLSATLTASNQASALRLTKKNTLAWQIGEQAKFELVDLIKKKRTWVRMPARLFRLFENPDDKLQIFWNRDRLEELAHLVFLLYDKGIIGCIGGRGTFSVVEQHLQDFNGNSVSAGTLKKLSSRINRNWTKYEQRMKAVSLIVQAIQEKARH